MTDLNKLIKHNKSPNPNYKLVCSLADSSSDYNILLRRYKKLKKKYKRLKKRHKKLHKFLKDPVHPWMQPPK